MVTPTKFYFTSHARRRSGERAIDLALFKKIVLAPDCKKQHIAAATVVLCIFSARLLRKVSCT
jgi:hypothetical protein